MKRTLLVLGAFALLIGLGVAGTHFWALLKIHQHGRFVEARLAQQRLRTRPPLFGPALPGNAPGHHWETAKAVDRLPEADVIARLREGLRRTDLRNEGRNVYDNVLGGLEEFIDRGAESLRNTGNEAEAFEWLAIGFGVAQDMLPSAPWILSMRELDLVNQGMKILQSHALSAGELEEIARRLDALARTRPPLVEYNRDEDAFERKLALQGNRQDFCRDVIILPVERKHLWLSSIARAATLNEIASYYRRLEDLETLPAMERVAAAEADGLPWARRQGFGNRTYHRAEIESLTYRAILRAAVAAAWHEAKTGRLPASLTEIPGYVPDAATAGLWTYSSGTLTCLFDEKSWTIRRRS